MKRAMSSSKPTVWDGDSCLFCPHSYVPLVPSPPCGMATHLKLQYQRLKMSSEPTVWDGDAGGSCPSMLRLKAFGSEPTVWDGDYEIIAKVLDLKQRGSKPTVWDGDAFIYAKRVE